MFAVNITRDAFFLAPIEILYLHLRGENIKGLKGIKNGGN
jgi:hypothetical protein